MKKEIIIFCIASFLFGLVLGMVIMNAHHKAAPVPMENIATEPSSTTMPETQGTQSEMNLPPGHPDLSVDYQKEIEKRLELLKQSPDDTKAMVEIAQYYFQIRKQDEALAWYEKAINKDKNNAEALSGAANIYLRTENTEKAKIYFQNALTVDKFNPQALLGLGWIKLHKEKDLKGAIALWELVLEHHPNYPFNDVLKEEIEKIKKQTAP